MWDSNPRPLAHKTNALPTELTEFISKLYIFKYFMYINIISLSVLIFRTDWHYIKPHIEFSFFYIYMFFYGYQKRHC